jgi:hypothetical protein
MRRIGWSVVCRSEHHESVADVGSGGRVGDDHGDEFWNHARNEHGEIQRDDGNDDRELGGDIDRGDGADGGNDRERGGDRKRGGEQRFFVHGSRGSEHYEFVADIGAGGRIGDDHGDELRIDAGYEHGEVQRHVGDGHELGCIVNKSHSADGRDDGQRGSSCQRGGQQRIVVHGSAEHHKSIADDWSGGRVGDDHGDELWNDPGHEYGEVQHNDSDDDHELGSDIDCGDGANERDDRERGGNRKRGG